MPKIDFYGTFQKFQRLLFAIFRDLNKCRFKYFLVIILKSKTPEPGTLFGGVLRN